MLTEDRAMLKGVKRVCVLHCSGKVSFHEQRNKIAYHDLSITIINIISFNRWQELRCIPAKKYDIIQNAKCELKLQTTKAKSIITTAMSIGTKKSDEWALFFSQNANPM